MYSGGRSYGDGKELWGRGGVERFFLSCPRFLYVDFTYATRLRMTAAQDRVEVWCVYVCVPQTETKIIQLSDTLIINFI